ncbi:MAG: hypothetical protein ABIL58_17855 [Pseudomonadota bacterium]
MTTMSEVMDARREPLAPLLLRRVRFAGGGRPSGSAHIIGRRHRKKKPHGATGKS